MGPTPWYPFVIKTQTHTGNYNNLKLTKPKQSKSCMVGACWKGFHLYFFSFIVSC